MKSLKKMVFAAFILSVSLTSYSSPSSWPASGKSDHIANPFVIIGFNPETQLLTGFVSAVRIAPGRTDECSFVFSGDLGRSSKLKLAYGHRGDSVAEDSIIRQDALLDYRRVDSPELRIKKPIADEDCDWILPFVGQPGINESEREISISLAQREGGDWIGVYAIKSERARFHGAPDQNSARKSYVVRGDVIYVYKWEGDWCYAKFEKNGKATQGWLRKSDILRLAGE